MVKVDELNEYIDKFGAVTEKLDTLAVKTEELDRISKRQEEQIEEARKLAYAQKDAIDLFKSQWSEAQISINTHIDNTESHLSDRIELAEYNLQKADEEVKKQIDAVKQEMKNYSSEFDKKIKSVKTLQYVSIIFAVITALLVVVMHYI